MDHGERPVWRFRNIFAERYGYGYASVFRFGRAEPIGQIAIALKTAQDAPGERSAAQKVSDAYVVRAPPGMFEDWHNADKKRYIVVISGEAEITTTGGEKASIVPGQIYLAADLTGKGHTFRVVGKQQWVALFVNFAE
jgi:quercetin dioxygenase-like cupin family protein